MEFRFESLSSEDDDIVASGVNSHGTTFKVIVVDDRDVLGGIAVNILTNDEAPMDTDYLVLIHTPVMRAIQDDGQTAVFIKGVAWALTQLEELEDEGFGRDMT